MGKKDQKQTTFIKKVPAVDFQVIFCFFHDFAVNLGHLSIYLAYSQFFFPKTKNFRVFSGDLLFFSHDFVVKPKFGRCSSSF